LKKIALFQYTLNQTISSSKPKQKHEKNNN